LLDSWKEDPEIRGLLLLHGLHPDDLSSRVRRAVADAAPVAVFLGVEVSVVRACEDEVRLRLTAAPDVPPEALAEFRGRIEATVLGQAPEVRSVRFEGEPARLALPLVGRDTP
jgi:hypothetical protein